MNKKKHGYLLLELLLSFSLGTVLIFVVYKTYSSVYNAVNYIENTNTFELEKSFLIYHLERDIFFSVVSKKNYEMYSLLKNINNNNNSENIFSLKSDLMKNESVDNKKEQLEKEYKKYALFIPSLVSINGDIVLSWITTRVLFSEDKWVKVSYVFIKNFTFEQKEVYKIIRREDQIGNDFQVIKKGKEYMLIEKISDLSVSFIYSLLSKENSQMNENSNNDKKNKDIFLDWQENPNYESLHSYDPIEENVEKNLNIFRFPSALVIDGKWVSRDTKKNYPFTICFSYPYATCIFQEYLFAISDKKNNSSKIDIKKNNDKVSLEKKVE